MNELQLFRTLDIDTIAIAARTHQTEAQVYNAMHAQRQEQYRISPQPHEKPLHVLAFNRRWGVGR